MKEKLNNVIVDLMVLAFVFGLFALLHENVIAPAYWRIKAGPEERIKDYRVVDEIDFGLESNDYTPVAAAVELYGLRGSFGSYVVIDDVIHKVGGKHFDMETFKALKDVEEPFDNMGLAPVKNLYKLIHEKGYRLCGCTGIKSRFTEP